MNSTDKLLWFDGFWNFNGEGREGLCLWVMEDGGC